MAMIFETDLDYSRIEKMSEQELFIYIKENFVSPNIKYPEGMSFERCVNVMKVLCRRLLKIQPSAEQWIFLLADCERLLCEACAGAGKTTMAQLRSIKEKLIHGIAGNNILALAYNNHAVDDMKMRHDFIIRKVNSLNLPELRRDTNISCYTFHGFCKSWVEDYLGDFGITNKATYLMSDVDRHDAMQMAVKAFKKQSNSKVYISDVLIESLLSLYSFIQETLRTDAQDEWKLCPSMSDLTELKTEEIADIYSRYERWKSLKKKMDFTDLVENMYKLCCKEAVLRRIRANYKIYILDEYQDLTPSMLRVIKIILEGDPELGIAPYNEAKLTCIGDGDQSIYGFRGTDPDNCIRFKESYCSPGHMVRVTAMSENRRCPNEIIEYARSVIESNSRRISKPIRGIKDGGIVNTSKYYNISGEMDILIQKLRDIPKNKLSSTCICYRNQSSSFMLGLRLVEAGIPFRIAKGHIPLTDKLSQSIFDVLNMLSYPNIPLYIKKALYKAVPKSATFTSTTISEIVDAEEEKGKQTGENKCFYEYEYPMSAQTITGFSEAIAALEHARKMHRFNKPMSTYVPGIIQLVRKYYLDWQLSKSNSLSKEYIEYITQWFSRDISYDDFMKQYENLKKNMFDSDTDKVCITTFHGLKGLEFDNVFIIDLNDTIFPGTELNQVKDLTNGQKDILECEARRLFYVALTRARARLELFFDAEVPSRYIRFFTPNVGLAKSYEDYIADDGGFLISEVVPAEQMPNTNVMSDLDGLDDLADLDALPAVEFVTESPMSERESIRAAATTFTEFFAQEAAQEERLKKAIGNENFQKISGKSTIMNILDRITSEN